MMQVVLQIRAVLGAEVTGHHPGQRLQHRQRGDRGHSSQCRKTMGALSRAGVKRARRILAVSEELHHRMAGVLSCDRAEVMSVRW